MHLRPALLAVLPLLALAACSSSGDSSATTAATAAVTTSAAQATTAAPTTAPPTTAAPTTAAATTTPVGTITIDADAAGPVQATVPLGTPMTITLTAATPTEFHLHGYDLEDTGTRVVLSFQADRAGTFELERHSDEKVLLVLTVTP